MLAASESIVSNAKKLTEPKQKVVRQTVTMPKRAKPQQKQRNAQQQLAANDAVTSALSAQPQKPMAPAKPQSPTDAA